MLIYKKMGFLESLKNSMGMTQAQSEGQQGGRSRRRKCKGGQQTAVGMEGGRRRRGRKSRKSRRGTRKHTRRHRR